MNILEMCDSEVASVGLDTSVEEAIRTMLECRVGAVAVIDENRRVAGIFTERDVLRRVALNGRPPAETPVRDVMTTPVEMGTLDTTPGQALATMIEFHYRHLPVVDDDGQLLGILSIRNVLQARIDTLTRQLDEARSLRPWR